MFRLHLPHRKWEKEQIILVETISDVIEEIWKWLPEIVNQEHIIIEQTNQPPNHAMHSDEQSNATEEIWTNEDESAEIERQIVENARR